MHGRIWASVLGLIGPMWLLMAAPPALAQTSAAPSGEQVFTAHCKVCHEPPVERAPSRADLARRPQADIVTAMTVGQMAPMAKGLSPAEMQAVAAYLSPTPVAGAGRPRAPSAGVDKMCAANPSITPGPSDWASFGRDAASTRYQPNPGFTLAEIPRLKVKWSFAISGGGAPTVVGHWLFVTNRSGKFYALDADTGCVHWMTPEVVSRTTPVVMRSSISPSGWAAFVGIANRTVRAFDAQTGKELWRSPTLEDHPASGITGSLAVSGEQIFVPLSSGEEGAAIQKTYPCCTFRGSLVALDLKTGAQQWKTYVIPEPPHPTRVNEGGVQMMGPAGAAIWSAPTVDAKRGVVYVATGDSYTEAETDRDDSIMAIDMKTGKVRWSSQVTTGDNYVMGCEPSMRSPNCPTPHGPDYDFGASPVLFTLKGGKQVLAAGQKSGIAYGLDPDTGKLLWRQAVGSGSALGGIEWGIGADTRHIYVPVADTAQLFAELAPNAFGGGGMKLSPAKPGLYALDPATGKVMWATPAPKAPCHYAGDRSRDYGGGACIRAQSAPPSAMPGAVFEGSMDGWLRAHDPATGKILWAFSTTAQTYDTANAVKDQPGGSLDGVGGGPTLANGMLYVMSGFNGAARTGGNGVNVLLAFSVDGK